jgi:hypothetical protein
MNQQQLADMNVEISREGSRCAYFYNDQVIAMEDKGVLTILPTDIERVSDIYCMMMEDTGYEHYLSNGVNYITDNRGNRDLMGSSFGVRVAIK